MQYIVVGLCDEVAGRFLSINIDENEASAKRGFAAALHRAQSSKEGLFYTNASDFALYQLGSFDGTTGNISPVVPRVLMRGERSGE